MVTSTCRVNMKTTKPFKEQGKDIFSPNRSDLIRAAIWICLIIFFLVTPAIILFVTIYIAEYFSLPNAQGDAVLELKKDASILLLSFYAGTVGAVIKYLLDRLYEGSESDAFMAKISKLLLGWLLGSCAFFVLKSGWIIKLLYPKLDTLEMVSTDITYYTLVFVALFSGFFAAKIVENLQRRTQG
jgi:hypothetical protein